MRFGLACNGAFRGVLFWGLRPVSVPGLRVVFAVVSPEDGSQPLTIHRCRGQRVLVPLVAYHIIYLHDITSGCLL